MELKVGELALRTGLTVRTLHHYDEIGLVKPSSRTAADHRLYTAADVARLQKVVSLRQLGLSLPQIAQCLNDPDFDHAGVLRRQIERLKETIQAQQTLCRKLESLASKVATATMDDFLHAIERMNMIESYYTPEQLAALNERQQQLGDEGMQRAQSDWEQLFNEYREAMQNGQAPERLAHLEKRRQDLIAQFTGGDSGIAESLQRLWQEQGDQLAAQHGYEPELMVFVERVAAATKG